MTDRSEWLEWRRGGVGGSDIAALLGLSNYASPFSLWCEKVGLVSGSDATPRQRVGQVLEPAIAVLFHEDTGLYAAGEQTWCTHPDYDWARCTVDGFVYETPSSLIGALGTHQIKTDARFGWDEVPVNIRAQCVWEMGVTQQPHCWLSVLHGGFTFRVYEIPWDDDAEADWKLMLERAETFWNHVVTGVMPSIDGSDATASTLRTLYPDHEPGRSVDLDGMADIIVERAELKDRAKSVKARLDEIDNQLKAALADAEVGMLAGLPAFTYRSSERAGYEVAPTTVRTLRPAPIKRSKT